jgi:Ser/Thr protein kinase RdoA (MazF antagonist)
VTAVRAALRAWPYRVDSVAPLGGGWNSTTWRVSTPGGRFVAKLVDDLDAPGLVSGLRVAEFLAARGLACGAPARTRDGDLTVRLRRGSLALLRFEPGTPPDLSVESQVRRAGQVLARVHGALRDFPADADPRFRWPWEWVADCLDTAAMPPKVRAAARRVWAEIVTAVADRQLSMSVIHADPGPEGFLLTGEDSLDALIDWTTPLYGPLLYNLACFAVLSRSAGPQAARWFTEGYSAAAPEIGQELAWTDHLVKARWLANAIYFASRIERGIERGSDSPGANEDGLAEAYAGLTAAAD